jgi:Domain of unknown function (DUF4388)
LLSLLCPKVQCRNLLNQSVFLVYDVGMSKVQNLSGTIQEGFLANLLQYLAINRVSGYLKLETVDTAEQIRVGQIYFRQGRVTHAITGSERAVTAIATLMLWNSGEFSFRTGEFQTEISIDTSLEHLLMEVSKRLDEHQKTFDPYKLHAGTVLQRREIDELEGAIPVPGNAILLLASADGRQSLGQLAKTLNTPLEALIQIAQQLLDIDLLLVTTRITVDAGSISPSSSNTGSTSSGSRGSGPINTSSSRSDSSSSSASSSRSSRADSSTHDTWGSAVSPKAVEKVVEKIIYSTTDPAFVDELSTTMIRILGPVGEIILEDALDELNLQADSLSTEAVGVLLREVYNQLKSENQRQQFNTTVRALRSKYHC